MITQVILFIVMKAYVEIALLLGVSLWCNGKSDVLQNGSKRVQTPVMLLCSLSDKYPLERYESPYPPSYG